jgi:hypothetical protein
MTSGAAKLGAPPRNKLNQHVTLSPCNAAILDMLKRGNDRIFLTLSVDIRLL